MGVRQLLHFSCQGLRSYRVRGERVSPGAFFEPTPCGISAFGDHVASAGRGPVYVLVDVAQEEFHAEAIPFLRGRDRNRLLQRKLDQTFRTARYRGVTRQGREPAGRRDERVLFSALTDTEGLTPWLRELEARQVELAGIGSMALWTEVLAQRLDGAAPHLLLIVLQDGGTIRQSYFRDRCLKLSRLLPGDAGSVAQEAARMRDHLNAQRLLGRDEPLTVAVLAPAPLVPSLEALCADTGQLGFTFTAPDDSHDGEGLSVARLIALARPRRLPNLYAGPQELRVGVIRRRRRYAYGVSALLLASAVGCGSEAVSGAREDDRLALGLAAQAAEQAEEYRRLAGEVPAAGAPASHIESVAGLYTAIETFPISPFLSLAPISRALNAGPDLHLEKLAWGAQPPVSGQSRAQLQLEGRMTSRISTRVALEQVEGVFGRLRQAGFEVIPTALPVDARPSGSLQGNLDGGTDATDSRWSVKLMTREKW